MKGYSQKLVKWCAKAPLLQTLRLEKPGVEILDFGNTHLEYLELDMDGIRELILPQTIRSLQMYGSIPSGLQIRDAFCVGKIDLYISLKKAGPLRYGLKNLQICRLHLLEIHEFDMIRMAECSKTYILQELTQENPLLNRRVSLLQRDFQYRISRDDKPFATSLSPRHPIFPLLYG